MPTNSQISIKYDNLVGENTYPDITNNPGIYPGYLKCGV